MTEENYRYRTSQELLRNQFPGTGALRIPVIPKFEAKPGDFDDLLLIGYDKTRPDDQPHLDRMVHFFLYDYRFERVWKQPDGDIEKLSQYRAVLSPDFSMYLEMAPVMQIYNVFRNRWCGAYWASKGIRVVPTVSWGGEDTFEFCFDGISKGSTVAVSTYMVSEHGNQAAQKEFFMRGYRELLRRIEPEQVICYNEPFPEMEGNIIFVDYELSSWKYLDDSYVPSKYVAYILGEQPVPNSCSFKVKSGHVLQEDTKPKGMGSAFGGKWRPNPSKPADQRYIGIPGEIKRTIMPNGDVYQTKIGPDGRAVMERHHTVHNRPDKHTNPHDHEILWSTPDGHPEPQPPINYPNEVPEFKQYIGGKSMGEILYIPNDGSLNFASISDFKWCVSHGGEVEFKWNGKVFGIWSKLRKIPKDPFQILISQVMIEDIEDTEKWCDTADEVLEYIVDGVRLREIITEVEVTARTI